MEPDLEIARRAMPPETGVNGAAPAAPLVMADGPVDARRSNWRFVVPDEPTGLLLLPIQDETLAGSVVPDRTEASLDRALEVSHPAAAVPDLGSWGRLGGGSLPLLRRLAAAVQPGGWMYVGCANARYPGSATSRNAVRPGVVRRELVRAGFTEMETYLAFPDQRCPAYLVSVAGRRELDYFLRRLAFPYADPSSRFGRPMGRRVLGIALSGASVAPHSFRTWSAPAVAFVARRPR
jgi:hypothetical protein